MDLCVLCTDNLISRNKTAIFISSLCSNSLFNSTNFILFHSPSDDDHNIYGLLICISFGTFLVMLSLVGGCSVNDDLSTDVPCPPWEIHKSKKNIFYLLVVHPKRIFASDFIFLFFFSGFRELPHGYFFLFSSEILFRDKLCWRRVTAVERALQKAKKHKKFSRRSSEGIFFDPSRIA